MNWAALQQKVDRVFSLIYAWIGFIPAFFSSTPQDVTVTWENEDGSTTTQTFPNLKKMLENIHTNSLWWGDGDKNRGNLRNNLIELFRHYGTDDQQSLLLNIDDTNDNIVFGVRDKDDNYLGERFYWTGDVWTLNGHPIVKHKKDIVVDNVNVWDADITGENVFGDTAVGAGAAEMRGEILLHKKDRGELRSSLRFEINRFGDISPQTDAGVSFAFDFLAFAKREIDADIVGFEDSPQGTAFLWAATHNSDTDYAFHDKTGSKIRWTLSAADGKMYFSGNDFQDLGISESATFDALVIDLNQINIHVKY